MDLPSLKLAIKGGGGDEPAVPAQGVEPWSSGVMLQGFGAEDWVDLLDVLEGFNEHHDDALALIARTRGVPNAREARVRGFSSHAMQLAARTPEGVVHTVLVPLEPAVTAQTASARVVALVVEARKTSGNGVQTTRLERELALTRTLPTYVATVSRTRRLSPNLREVTLRGHFEGFEAVSADHFVFVQVPRSGHTDAVIREGSTMASLRAAPESERPAGAYYTVRAFRPDAGEVDLWFVLHEPRSGVGGWAADAKSGDRVALWGPRGRFEVPEDVQELLLVGDETALPSIASILDFMKPRELPTQVVVEIPDSRHTVRLPVSANVQVHWAFRGQHPVHESSALLSKVSDVAGRWRPGLFLFGAAESSRVASLRGELRALGFPRGSTTLTSYWRHGKALNG
ncbi:MAG: siderophore-interacting protein [Nannocystaceae bacterium]|nr:siderophore-interacting protein [Nannocystaceae bacterium]